MIEAIEIDDPRWDELSKDTDVFYQREYMKAFVSPEWIPMLIHYKDGDCEIVYPLFLRPLQLKFATFYDTTSPYGYGGPALKGRLSVKFFRELHTYCLENKIISEFGRLHPWLSTMFSKREKSGEIVYIDLTKNENEILANMTKSCRNAIKSAEKKLYIRVSGCDYEILHQLYMETMKRNNADPKYYFSLKIIKSLPNATYSTAFENDTEIASAVFLRYGDFCHYFLVGSNRTSNAGNLIIWEAIKHFKKEGCKILNLGGTIDNNKGLLMFKQSFSKTKKSFYVTKTIHQKEIYDLICKVNGTNPKGIFPAYR